MSRQWGFNIHPINGSCPQLRNNETKSPSPCLVNPLLLFNEGVIREIRAKKTNATLDVPQPEVHATSRSDFVFSFSSGK